eukprot:TRINITY_DN199_c0_g2_i1.p1 TRINITY_DN199_c0_g2~~TRINITY_DN199_c0_g2_i1.p1  ORF type:complete len:93 (-),score=17.69 TRINITY_DN199_c0_g2_i1:45-323(-)
MSICSLLIRRGALSTQKNEFILRGGLNWRQRLGLHRSGNETGPLHDEPDFKFEDGSLAPKTPKQKKWERRRQAQLERIEDLKIELDQANNDK